MLKLNETTELGLQILHIENLMRKANIRILARGKLVLDCAGREYSIGRDSDEFPRSLEEPIWRDA